MKLSRVFFSFWILISSTLASAATSSKGHLKPTSDDRSVSATQAQTEAKKIFCGIESEKCDLAALTSKCVSVENKSSELAGFKCQVQPNTPVKGQHLEALKIKFSKNLAYMSSEKTNRIATIDPTKENVIGGADQRSSK